MTIYKLVSAGSGAAHIHDFGEYESDNNATCFVDGTQSATCECGVVKTIPLKGSKTEHDYVYEEGNKVDARNHYYVCSYCGGIKGEAHYGNVGTSEEETVCEVCNSEYEEVVTPDPTPEPTPEPTPTPTPADPKPELPYEDVKEGDWFYAPVAYTYYEELMTGMDEVTFAPYGQLSRAQFALILYRMEDEPTFQTEKVFHDISGEEWYGKAVLWAAEAGIVTGYTDGNFGPTDNITREQMAVMMHRYAKYLKLDVTNEGDISKFEDSESVSEFAREAMLWANANGIITGKEEGTIIDPQGNTARAEAAAIIQRFCLKIPHVIDLIPDIDGFFTDHSFDMPVVVNSSTGGSKILFGACTFNQGLVFNGTGGNTVVIDKDCSFADGTKVVVVSEKEDMTIYDSFPRLVLVESVEIECENCVNALCLGMKEVTFNGKTYTADDCEKALTEEGTDFEDIKADVEYSSIAVAQWWENGELITMPYLLNVE